MTPVWEMQRAMCGLCQMIDAHNIPMHPQLREWFAAHATTPGCEVAKPVVVEPPVPTGDDYIDRINQQLAELKATNQRTCTAHLSRIVALRTEASAREFWNVVVDAVAKHYQAVGSDSETLTCVVSTIEELKV